MNQTQTQIGLAGKLKAEAAEKARIAEKAAEDRMAIAQAWDASGFTGPQPYIIGSGGCYGDKGTLHFKALAPDELVALMKAFPVVPRISYVDGPRYFVPAAVRPAPEGVAVEQTDGFEIEISGGKGFGTLRAAWSAMVGEQQVHFWADLRPISYLHPRTWRRAVMFGGDIVRYEGPANLVWPKETEHLHKELAVNAVSYWKSDECTGNFRLRGTQMLQLAEAWEAEANRREADTTAAFEAAYAPVLAMGLPTMDAIAAKAEQMRAHYDAKAGGLRGGTLEQDAALEMSTALADKAVAEKHWVAYAKRHGIEARQAWFDHYAWACSYLQRVGLYEVPVTEAMRAGATGGALDNKTTYRYASAWL